MTPLHLPLSLLPGPVPMWTPGVFRVPDGATHYPVAICYPTEDDGMWLMEANNTGRPPIRLDVPASDVFVDLSPPPIDANGHPTRVDALPVLVDMLARAMGHPEGQRTLRPSLVCDEWVLRTWTDGGVYHFTRFPLAPIPLTDPNATRLALVALFAARVWETP